MFRRRGRLKLGRRKSRHWHESQLNVRQEILALELHCGGSGVRIRARYMSASAFSMVIRYCCYVFAGGLSEGRYISAT